MNSDYVFLIRSGVEPPETFVEAMKEGILREFQPAPGRLPPWLKLKEQIEEAAAVCLLKGSGFTRSFHSSNWVSWELGVAAAAEKPVWVFESLGEPAFVPLPYLTDYVPFDPNDGNHIQFLRAVFGNLAARREAQTGLAEICPHCGSLYAMHTAVLDWNCPFCQRRSRWTGLDTSEMVSYLPPSYLLQVNEDLRHFARDYPDVTP